MKCDYVYDLLLRKFKLWGGDMSWIESPKENLPDKLKRIRYFVMTMIVRPYELINQEHSEFKVKKRLV